MLRRSSLVLLMTATLLSAISITGEAMAGGPTSVLVTNLDTERAAAIYYTDEQYTELENLLHGANTTKSTEADPPSGGGTYLNVTWLVHDVSVWRTDQLVLDIEGSPWVYTQLPLANGEGVTGEKWRSLKDGGAIVDLLGAVGVVGDDSPGAAADTVAAVATPSVESANDATVSAWRWAIPGVVLGLVVGFLIARWQTRETRPPSDARQVTVG